MLESLEARFSSFDRSVTLLEGKKQELTRQLTELSNRVAYLQDDIQVLERVNIIFDKMLGDLVKVSLDRLQSLLTAGLRSIFEDQKLSVRAELTTEKKQPCLNFYLLDETHGVEAPIKGNFGGGPIAVADLLLRVLVILKLNLARVLFLDEALSQVSIKYLSNAGDFIRKLCAKLGMTVLLVTHADFGKSADRVYRAECRGGELRLIQEGATG
jgi:hypothetical protein